mgnify:CR=1 FL=1
MITLEAELTKKEYGLLRASILVHIEIATISGKNGRTKLQDHKGELEDVIHAKWGKDK